MATGEVERTIEATLPPAGLDATLASSSPTPDAPATDDTMLSEPGGPGTSAGRPSNATPERIARYLVTRRLGAGGMGVVYAAYDPELDRRVAIKLLLRPRGAGDPLDIQRRLQREAQALAQLNHPAVIQVYDVGTWEGQVYIAVEYVDGETLGAWFRRGPALRQILAKFHQAGQGLAAAHEAGIVHRDFKPDNVLIDGKGRVRVLDFGLAVSEDAHARAPAAKPASSDGELALERSTSSLHTSLTMTGALLGTPAYMAPEQFSGQIATHLSDQFSFCVALYEALYGERPFAGDGFAALAFAVLQGQVRPPASGRRVPPRLRRVLLRGLAVTPSERYPSMDALLAALAPFWSGERRLLTWVGVPLLVGLAGVATALAVRTPPVVPDACAAVAASWGEAWTPARAQQLEARFALDTRPYLAQVHAQVRARLDAYAARWAGAHEDACRARGGDATGSLYAAQTQCFDRARRSTAAVVDALLREDANLDAALELIDALPDLATCSNVDWLVADVEPPPPEQVEAVAELRQQLDLVRISIVAARHDEAATSLTRVAEQIAALGYPPLTAELELVEAKLAAARSDWDRALASATRGYAVAEAAGDDPLAASIAAELAWWTAEGASKYEPAQVWVTIARAGADRLRLAPAEHARIDAVEAHIAGYQGRHDEAIALYRAAIAGLEGSSAARAEELAELRKGLAYVYNERGDKAAALAESEAAYASIVGIHGEHHPTTAEYLLRLAQAQQTSGRLDAALASRERALTILREAFGPSSDPVGKALFGLADSATLARDHETAVRYLRQALEIFRETRGPRSRHAAAVHNNLGNALRLLARYPDAIVELEQARELYVELFGPDTPNLAYVHYNLGQCHDQLGHAEALAHLAEAHRIHQVHQLSPLERGRVAQIYAELLLRRGDLQQAAARAAEAIDVLAPLEPGDASALAAARETLLLAQRGERPRGSAASR